MRPPDITGGVVGGAPVAGDPHGDASMRPPDITGGVLAPVFEYLRERVDCFNEAAGYYRRSLGANTWRIPRMQLLQ